MLQKKVVTKCVHLKHALQTLLHCLLPLMMLFEALPNLVAFNPGTKEICVWSSWQQKVNSGPRVRGQQQLGWHGVAEAVAGIHYISFRSSRVWSSILCVQRCSSLVDFSLSGRNKSRELQISIKQQRVLCQRKLVPAPSPHAAAAILGPECLAGCSWKL